VKSGLSLEAGGIACQINESLSKLSLIQLGRANHVYRNNNTN